MKLGELDITHANNSALLITGLHRVLDELNLSPKRQLEKITSLIEQLGEHLRETPESDESTVWQIVLAGLRTLRSNLRCQEMAMDDSGDILAERERLLVLSSEFRRQISNSTSSSVWIEKIFEKDVHNINTEQLIAFLGSTPIPLTYWKKRRDDWPAHRSHSIDEHANSANLSLVRVIAFIDSIPLISPQLLKPRLMYSLRFVVQGMGWPDKAKQLRLDLLTTYPPTDYSVSEFSLQKPSKIENDRYEGELIGHIRFNTAQTLLSENISFVIRCAFELSDGSYNEIRAIGHDQLEFWIVDEKSSFMSGRPLLDQHIAQLLQKLVKESPAIRDELPNLIPVLEALTRLLGTYAQGSVFKRDTKVSERDFQADVLRDLRFILGQDVQEHPSQAGGYTDIYYHGVVIELKVEEKNGDRTYICQRYTQQPTQYEGVEARQVSTLLVLDLTSKREPPGDIRNDILLVDVPTHGGEDENKRYASKAFVFIVNGNTENPSHYSKK